MGGSGVWGGGGRGVRGYLDGGKCPGVQSERQTGLIIIPEIPENIGKQILYKHAVHTLTGSF